MRTDRSLSSAAMLAASLMVAGCSLAPLHERPSAPLTSEWKVADAATAAGGDQAASIEALDWRFFVGNAYLRQLVDEALQNNRNLRQTLLNVEAVRAQYRIQRAERWPGLEAQVSGVRQRNPVDAGVAGLPGVQSNWQAGVAVTAFELDLFGRTRNLSEAALEEFLSSEDAAHGVRISLVAEVIQAYLTRDDALHRQRLTAQTLRSREMSLQLMSRRLRSGAATALDYEETVGLAEQARADLERIDRELRQASNALELLVGTTGLALPRTPSDEPLLLQDFAAGAPSALLTNRPDIRAAEHRLRSRNASIGAARAAFFPRISLAGSLGTSSQELDDLFSSGGRSWSFTPQLSLPIFDGGRNRANLDLANLRKEIAISEYEQAIQVAFREVSDALAAVDTLRREEVARRALAGSSQTALRLSELRWRAGVDDHLRYLDAQRSAFANQMAYIQTSTQKQIALSNLFKTLGGGGM